MHAVVLTIAINQTNIDTCPRILNILFRVFTIAKNAGAVGEIVPMVEITASMADCFT